MKKYTTETFIENAKIVHNNTYDYSKVNYKGIYSKIIIICPKHGEFEQRPSDHINGAGCKKCGYNKISFMSTLTKQQFIEKAKEIHNNKYDYSKVDYKHSQIKVIIRCPIHGDFFQTPANHLQGTNCPKCNKHNLAAHLNLGINEFIKKSVEKHGNIYDYSKVNYINNRTKVIIICPEHGEFEQSPAGHLKGQQCPKCNYSKGEAALEEIFKKHNIKYIREYKLPLYKFRYDFYLPEHNLLIEFHGGQHFFPVKWFGGIEAFKEQQKKDAFKRSLAREYKIPLIEIHYKAFKKSNKNEFENFVLNLTVKGVRNAIS